VWALQRAAASQILHAASDEGVFTVVIKGSEVLNRYFQSRGLSFLNDIDILVAREDIQAIKRLLYANGYAQHLFNSERQALLPRDIREIADIEANHYELAPFNRLEPINLTEDEAAFVREWNWHPIWPIGDRYFAVMEFDVHYGVAFDVEGTEFFPRCEASSFGAGHAMSEADQLWFITSRFYNEVGASGKSTARDLAYVAALMTGGRIDWSVIVSAAERYDMRPSLYYYFLFVDWITGAKVIPADVIDALRPSRGSRARDWGWQVAKLLGADEQFTPAVVGEVRD
jgi:hypothetical protein